jgi:deoxyribodipyrimidine photo-lyase
MAALYALDRDLRSAGGPGLSVMSGNPVAVVPYLAKAYEVQRVHISADFGPYGRSRDHRVAGKLSAQRIELVRTGSPYAGAPGTLKNDSGRAFQVFGAFHRAWRAHGICDPAPEIAPGTVQWLQVDDRVRLDTPNEALDSLADEGPARAAWRNWLHSDSNGLAEYGRLHDFPGADATSRTLNGYPEPIVVHAVERKEALDRYAVVKDL